MLKVAVVILADRARVANVLTTAYEFKEAGDAITLIFTGARTKWGGELSDPDHRLHRTCAVSFGVKAEVQASGVPLLTEYRGHQSLRNLVIQGY